MANKIYTHTTGGPIAENGLTLNVPVNAVPEGTTVVVQLDKVVPPDPETADGLTILRLWKVTAMPPTALNLAAQLAHPVIEPRSEAQQQFRLQDQTNSEGMPIPLGWMPVEDTLLGNARTDGSVGHLPPFEGAPASSTTWVALVGL